MTLKLGEEERGQGQRGGGINNHRPLWGQRTLAGQAGDVEGGVQRRVREVRKLEGTPVVAAWRVTVGGSDQGKVETRGGKELGQSPGYLKGHFGHSEVARIRQKSC